MTVYRQRFAIGRARAEGRQPSYDGEYITVYAVDPYNWCAEDNGGLVAWDIYSLEEAVMDAAGDDTSIAEAEEIQAEIKAALH